MVVTHGPSTAIDYVGTLADALTAANRGLDYLAVQARADCAIRDAHDQSLIWWPDADLGTVVMRLTVVQTLGLILDLVGTVTYPDGTVPAVATATDSDGSRRVQVRAHVAHIRESLRRVSEYAPGL